MPTELKAGEEITLDLEFETKFPHTLSGDQSYHRGVYTWRFGWHPIAVPAENLIDGQYISEKKPYYKYEIPAGRFQVNISVPLDYRLATGADEVKEGEESEGWKSYSLTNKNPIRQVALHMGKGLNKYLLEGEIPIEVYYMKGHEEEARLFATYARDILNYYQNHYGTYSRQRLVIAEANTSGYFGLAADGLIILGSSFFKDKDLTVPGLMNRFTDYVIAHELAHQWWGIGVGVDFNAQNYLSESFAEYLSITYFEDKYGEYEPNLFKLQRKGLLEELVENRLGFYNLREHMVELPYLEVVKDRFDEAIIKPLKDVKYGNYSNVRIYNKGYLVLRSLEGVVGKDTLNEILNIACAEYNHKIVTTANFKKLAEEVSGTDLTKFFDQNLRSPYSADYGVRKLEVKETADGYVNKIHLIHQGQIDYPVPVVAVTKDGQSSEITWDPQVGEVITLETEEPISEVKVDPKSMFLDVNRLNNYYPRKFKIITNGKNALPLDSYLMKFDPFTQTLQGGFLWHSWLIGNNWAAFTQYLSRGFSITGIIGTNGRNLLGRLTMDIARYSHPSTGSPATYWEPSTEYQLSFTRDLTGDQGITNYLSFDFKRQETINYNYTTNAELLVDPFSFSRFTLAGVSKIRILPNISVDTGIKLGFSFGRLPRSLEFTLDELESFGRWIDKYTWKPYLFPGEAKLFGKLSLSFPLQREMGYYVANLAKIDTVEGVFFLKAGYTGYRLSDFSLDDLKTEIGTEFNLAGTSFGGLFSVNLRVGYAYPLTGMEESAKAGVPYISFEIPFL